MQDVEFEEGDRWERVSVDSDYSDEDLGEPIRDANTKYDDPEGELTSMNRQEASRSDVTSTPISLGAPPEPPGQLSEPPTLHRSTHANKGIPCTCPDKDPKMGLGSRPPGKKTVGIIAPHSQNGLMTSGSANTETTDSGGTPCNDDVEEGALYLTVDTPCTYQEAIG